MVGNRSLYPGDWLLESGSGARKGWLPRGIEKVYDGNQKDPRWS